jgi:hypothetical protein
LVVILSTYILVPLVEVTEVMIEAEELMLLVMVFEAEVIVVVMVFGEVMSASECIACYKRS